jgi:transposase
MNTHDNARLTPKGREDMVRAVVVHRLTKAAAARQFNTTPKTVAKWVARFKAQGVVGLRDRSSKPLSSPSQTSLATADTIEALRRQRRAQQHIAGELGISKATVSRILKRRGLSLLSALEPQQQRPRYERETPGEIIHIDIKKLGRFNAIGHRITGDRSGQSNARGRRAGPGWEFVHVAIDDHSRVATAAIFPMKRRRAPSPSCAPPSPTTKASASPSIAS